MQSLIDHVRLCFAILAEAVKWPSAIPTWQWIERNVELPQSMSDWPGPVRFDFFPANKTFLIHCDNPRLRRATVMKCAQSGFTENCIFHLMRRIVDRPVTTMWVGATAQKTEEDAKKRIWTAISNCPAVAALAPGEDDRERWTRKLVMFDSMNLMIRGSESRMALQGDPAGLLICDERREWKPGRIELLRKRTRTKLRPLEISIGAAGVKGDALHTDWLEGSQTFIHFACLECQHSQPFRFGRLPTTLFPDTRDRGGIVWDENETTKPGGVWNFEEVKKTVRYECEHCGRRYHNSEKGELLRTCHEFHRNPTALPKHFSLHVPALLMPWIPECDWAEIAVEFLKAQMALKQGDMAPLMAFVQETLGEPWVPPAAYEQKGDLLERIGKYKLGEFWADPTDKERLEKDTALILTFDRQLMFLRYVIRQWRRNGQSRLIDVGKSASLDDLRDLQMKRRIPSRCVWGDDGGPNVSEFRQKAMMWGWGILKGEEYEYFSIQHREDGIDKSHRQGYRQTAFDPGIGTTREGLAMATAYLWSNAWYKDKLYFLFIHGLGPLWEIAENTPQDYLEELNANEWRQRENRATGQVEYFFFEAGADHAADCELMQLVVADIGGLTRYLPREVAQK